MENPILVFSNPQFGEIRTIKGENDETWFVGKDVATVLGYAIPQKAILEHVDEEDRHVLTYKAFSKTEKANLWSGNDYSNKILIKESGLYSLILASKLPQAKEFKHWVTSEVLPSIRNHGVYLSDQSLEKALTDPDYLIKLATVIKEERVRRQSIEEKVKIQNNLIAQQQSTIGMLDKQVSSLQKSVDEMQEKVSYLDSILTSPELMNITQIAQDYGLSAIKLNKILHNMKIQFNVNGQWILYMDYKDKGYAVSRDIPYKDKQDKEHFRPHTFWTHKGRQFLYYKLKAVGILPVMEITEPSLF